MQKQISNVSFPVQFYWITLFCYKYFVQYCNYLLLYHLKMLSQFEFQLATATLCSFFSAFNVMFGCIIFDYSRFALRHSVTRTLLVTNVNLSSKRACCLQLLVSQKANKSLNINLFWHRRLQVSSKGCCHTKFNESTEQMVKSW